VNAPGTAVMAPRCRAQLLSGGFAASAVDVVERLLAVQAQDARGFRLAVRARSVGVSALDVDYALSVERSLVVTTLNRGTLHLVSAQDYGWLHPLFAPPLLAETVRRLARAGVTPAVAERGVAAVTAALADRGPLARPELRSRLDELGVPTAGQTFSLIVALASLRGLVVRGPVIDGRHAWALVSDWLGAAAKRPRDDATAVLAQRYLAGHGPADEADLARWSGIALRQARAGLGAIADRLVDVGDGLVRLVDASGDESERETHVAAPDPRLLGPIVDDDSTLVSANGLFRPFALVGSRAVARWRLSGDAVTIEPFAPLRDDVADALRADAAALGRYLGWLCAPAVSFAPALSS
jgi:hypothetical protein